MFLGQLKGLWLFKSQNSYLCTYDLYGPEVNAFDTGSIHYEGKWEEVGPWKLILFWALSNGIEPTSTRESLGTNFLVS
jgi:hypothetical protein